MLRLQHRGRPVIGVTAGGIHWLDALIVGFLFLIVILWLIRSGE